MKFCNNCGKQLLDNSRYCPVCGHQQKEEVLTPLVQDNPSFVQTNQFNNSVQPAKPETYLVLSILTTFFCCLPLGVVAIIYSTKVDELYRNGEFEAALNASEKAKRWSIISIVLFFLLIILYLIFIAIVGIEEFSNVFEG